MTNDLAVTNVINVYKASMVKWRMPAKIYRPASALIYFTDGAITYHFDHGDETATAGCMLIFPQGLHYNGDAQSETQSYFVIDFKTASPDELGELGLPLVIRDIGEWEKHSFIECEKIWRTGSLDAPLLLKERIYGLLANALRHRRSSYDAKLLQEIVSYLHRHYTDQDLCVSGVAERFNVSESQLRRIFAREFGLSPIRYILNLRITLAKNLLSYEHLSVKETAERCGFQSEAYFSRRFKIITGRTPGSLLQR